MHFMLLFFSISLTNVFVARETKYSDFLVLSAGNLWDIKLKFLHLLLKRLIFAAVVIVTSWINVKLHIIFPAVSTN